MFNFGPQINGDPSLVVDRMLTGIAKKHPETDHASKYGKLRPEDTFQLLNLPLLITFELASLAGQEQVREIVERIMSAEEDNNLNSLSEAI